MDTSCTAQTRTEFYATTVNDSDMDTAQTRTEFYAATVNDSDMGTAQTRTEFYANAEFCRQTNMAHDEASPPPPPLQGTPSLPSPLKAGRRP